MEGDPPGSSRRGVRFGGSAQRPRECMAKQGLATLWLTSGQPMSSPRLIPTSETLKQSHQEVSSCGRPHLGLGHWATMACAQLSQLPMWSELSFQNVRGPGTVGRRRTGGRAGGDSGVAGDLVCDSFVSPPTSTDQSFDECVYVLSPRAPVSWLSAPCTQLRAQTPTCIYLPGEGDRAVPTRGVRPTL